MIKSYIAEHIDGSKETQHSSAGRTRGTCDGCCVYKVSERLLRKRLDDAVTHTRLTGYCISTTSHLQTAWLYAAILDPDAPSGSEDLARTLLFHPRARKLRGDISQAHGDRCCQTWTR